MSALRRLDARAADGLLAAGLLVFVLACASGDGDDRIGVDGLAAALLCCAPLAVRRRWPEAVLGLSVAGMYAAMATFEPTETIAVPVMLAVYTVAAQGDRRRTVAVSLAVVPVVLLLGLAFKTDELLSGETLKNLGLGFLPVAAGAAVAHERAAVARAAREREEEAQRRVAEERLRIARDVHDVVAHAIVAVNVQAGVAAHLVDRRPEAARDALVEIKRVSGEALADLRATLGLLREPSAPAPTAPVAGLLGLDDLAARVRAAGVALDVEVHGDVGALPSAVGQAGFRILQEALTNVLRHSGAGAARVRVTVRPGAVDLEVADDGPADGAPAPLGAPPGSGHGVRGMRERAAAVGGVLEAGPRGDGGWRVHALLPVPVAVA